MATTSSSAVLLALVCFQLFNAFTSSVSIPYSSSSVAFDQLKFWSINVRNNMPKAVLSKLSPMSRHESDYFSSLLSTKSFERNAAFCSIACLACSVDTYKTHVAKSSAESGLKENEVHVADSSKVSKQNGHAPHVEKGYLPSGVNSYNLCVDDLSDRSELGGYILFVGKESRPSGLNSHDPHVEGSLKTSEPNSNDPYVTNESHHSMLVDPRIFFRLSILERGNKVLLPSSLNFRLPHRALLPKQVAKKILLSPNELKRIFPNSFVSPVTRNAILNTLSYCNAPAVMGDIKSCPNSLEDMIQFSQSVLGEQFVVALTTESENGSGHELMIEKITSIPVKKYVACHELFLPFATHYCHFPQSTDLYRVDFVHPDTKIPANKVLALCHMNTSNLPTDHVALRALNLAPGEGEVCHWLLPTDIVWVGDRY